MLLILALLISLIPAPAVADGSPSAIYPFRSDIVRDKGQTGLTTARATTASMIDSAGVLWAVDSDELRFNGTRYFENLFLYSEDFSDAAWINDAGTTKTLVPGICPDSSDGYQFSFGISASADIYQGVVGPAVGDIIHSRFQMRTVAGSTTLRIRHGSGGAAATETVTSSWAWYENTSALTTDNFVGLRNNSTGSTSDIYICAAQVGRGSTVMEYIETTSAADHRVSGLATDGSLIPSVEGLLIEGSVTNLFTTPTYPTVPATQQLTLGAGLFAVSIYGAGTVTPTAGTATITTTPSVASSSEYAIVDVSVAGTVDFTVSGADKDTKIQVESRGFPSSFQSSSTARVVENFTINEPWHFVPQNNGSISFDFTPSFGVNNFNDHSNPAEGINDPANDFGAVLEYQNNFVLSTLPGDTILKIWRHRGDIHVIRADRGGVSQSCELPRYHAGQTIKFTMTWDTDNVKCYTNGYISGSKAAPASYNILSANLRIGSQTSSVAHGFLSVKNIKVYNRTLSSGEILKEQGPDYDISVGIMTDTHFDLTPDSLFSFHQRYQQGVIAEFNKHSLDLLLNLGDVLDGDFTSLTNQTTNITTNQAYYDVSNADNVYWVMGNHDFKGTGATVGNFVAQADYHPALDASGEANFVFDIPGTVYRFVIYDNTQSSGIQFTTPTNTLTWLATALSDAQTAGKTIIVTSHVATWRTTAEVNAMADKTGQALDPDAQRAVIDTAKGAGADILFVLAGHTHVNGYRVLDDGAGDIKYYSFVNTGGTYTGSILYINSDGLMSVAVEADPDKILSGGQEFYNGRGL